MTLLDDLTVERYQVRIHPDGTIDPVQSFDELVAALRAEAKKPLPQSRTGYAKTNIEVRKWQNAEADRLIVERREKRRVELETIRREAAARLTAERDAQHKLNVLEALKGKL